MCLFLHPNLPVSALLTTTFSPIVVLADRSDLPSEYSHIPHDQLRHGTGHFSNVVLSPQPTNSPNDPLNVSQDRVGETLTDI